MITTVSIWHNGQLLNGNSLIVNYVPIGTRDSPCCLY